MVGLECMIILCISMCNGSKRTDLLEVKLGTLYHMFKSPHAPRLLFPSHHLAEIFGGSRRLS